MDQNQGKPCEGCGGDTFAAQVAAAIPQAGDAAKVQTVITELSGCVVFASGGMLTFNARAAEGVLLHHYPELDAACLRESLGDILQGAVRCLPSLAAGGVGFLSCMLVEVVPAIVKFLRCQLGQSGPAPQLDNGKLLTCGIAGVWRFLQCMLDAEPTPPPGGGGNGGGGFNPGQPNAPNVNRC